MKYFIYCRKSSEDKQRQVLSIQSQRREAEKSFSGKDDIQIVGIFEEERSAMKLGRPVFAEMVRKLEAGEAEGIITWSPDRLARNSVDGGHIVYLLDCNVLRDLKFCTYTFENNSQGKFMLQIMFGQSKYYSDALSENVRRGVRTKIENGWWPTIAPLGYRNDRETNTIAIDPERFPLVREMFRMFLTGAYSAEEVWQASRSWGLLTPQRRTLGGKPPALSTVYKILYNPFYAGIIPWGGKWHQGKHPPMITLEEHERVKEMLRRPGRPQPQKLYFAFSGLITCGACGLSVTAENKTNRWGSQYIYYHCTKRLRPRCNEPSVEVHQLEEQVRQYLEDLFIPAPVCDWVAEGLVQEQQSTTKKVSDEVRTLDATIYATERRLRELVDMRSRRLLEDAEYLAMREDGNRELLRLRQSRNEREKNEERWFEPSQTLILFSNRAISWFENGTDEEKRLIVTAVGSNLTLKGKIVSIQARKSFQYIPRERNFPNLRRHVKNIRKMVGTSDLNAAITAIKKVEALRRARLGPDEPPVRSVIRARSVA
ncbi:MAG: recombinase family protein [Rhizomicrobium sp.]|nr:recombinase family protein [Rhizomicrobium sp.]